MPPLLFFRKPCPVRLPRHTRLTIGRGGKGGASLSCINMIGKEDPDGGIVGFLNDAAIFTDVDRVKNTRFITRNLIYTKDFTFSAVGIAIEYHIAAQPRTPFCHYVAFHP